MSFDIQWDTICNDEELALSFKEFLNSKLSSVELPHYLSNLQVVDFKLGNVAPELTIRDIDIPFHEFYVSVYSNSNDTEKNASKVKSGKPKTEVHSTPMNKFQSNSRPPSPLPFMNGTNSLLLPRSNSGKPTLGHMGVGLGSFGIGGSNSSGQPPLSNGSNMSHVDSESNYFQHVNYESNNDDGKMLSSLLKGVNGIKINSFDGNYSDNGYASNSNTSNTIPMASGATNNNNNNHHSINLDYEDHPIDYENLDTSFDLQFSVDVNWHSALYIEVTCDLLVNYPAPGFIKLPVRLKITDLTIHSLLIAAVISKKVFISFLCDIDDEDNNEEQNSDFGSKNDTKKPKKNSRMKSSSGKDRIDILQDMKIEGEIGNLSEGSEVWRETLLNNNDKSPDSSKSENLKGSVSSLQFNLPYNFDTTNNFLNKSNNNSNSSNANEGDITDTNGLVLRNIGKIENFLTSAFRSMIINELAWPGWIELDFNDSNDDSEDSDSDDEQEDNPLLESSVSTASLSSESIKSKSESKPEPKMEAKVESKSEFKIKSNNRLFEKRRNTNESFKEMKRNPSSSLKKIKTNRTLSRNLNEADDRLSLNALNLRNARRASSVIDDSSLYSTDSYFTSDED